MQIKVFEGTSIHSVLKNIKKEFGPEAIILSQEEKPIGQNGHNVISIRAAIPETSRSVVGAQTASNENNPITEDIQFIKNLLVENFSHKKALANDQDRTMDHFRELKTIMLQSMRKTNSNGNSEVSPELQNLKVHLEAQNVDDALIEEMFSDLKNLKFDPNLASVESQIRDQAIAWMYRRIRISPPWLGSSEEEMIHGFLGASGSGKTSMIIKLMSHLKKNTLDLNMKIIGQNNDRLGGNSTLEIFSKIAGAKYISFKEVDELEEILANVDKRDLCLIDFCHDSLQSKHDLIKLKNLGHNISIHLVLSVCSKYQQMDAAVRRGSIVGCQSLMFSKLDEGWSFGDLFSLSNHWSLPLSYFSTGADLPGCLEKATRERVVERIFGS